MKKAMVVALAILVSLAAVATLTPVGRTAYSSVLAGLGLRMGAGDSQSDDLYTYSFETKATGKVSGHIEVDFDDASKRTRYLDYNRKKAEALIAARKARVPVTVSFSQPVPIDDLEALVQRSGMEVHSTTVLAISSRGTIGMYGARPSGGKLIDREALARDLKGPDAAPKGVLSVRGWVGATREGLGQFATDDRVYIADVVALEVAEKIAVQTGRKLEDVDVWAPAPYWLLARGVK